MGSGVASVAVNADDGQGKAKEGRPSRRRVAACPGGCRRTPGWLRAGAPGHAVPRRLVRRGGAGRGGARPARALRLHPATYSGPRRRQPVPVGRRAPWRRAPAGLSPLHADRPPVHAAAVRGPRVPRAPVQRSARRSRLRRRIRLRAVAQRLAGACADRGLAVRRLGAVSGRRRSSPRSTPSMPCCSSPPMPWCCRAPKTRGADGRLWRPRSPGGRVSPTTGP